MKAHPWTDGDDILLRQFHAEHHSDRGIAYILGRERNSILKRRKRLGLATHYKPSGWPKGCRHTPEARAKISEGNRRRWADPEFHRRMYPKACEAAALGRASKFTPPPRGTPEYRLYSKLRDVLGMDKAHIEFERMRAASRGGADASA